MDVKTVVTTIVAITIGVMLIGSLLVPIATSVMDNLASTHPDWANLIGVVVVISIVSLVAVALYSYTSK